MTLQSSLDRTGAYTIALITAAATFLVAYGFDAFGMHLKIDGELAADYVPPIWRAWIGQDRWAMALVAAVVQPYRSLTVVPWVLCFIGIALGLVATLRVIDETRSIPSALATAVALATPALYFGVSFTTLSAGIGAGYLACGVALSCIARRTARSAMAASLCFAFAIGVYQAFVSVALTLLVLVHLLGTIADRPASGTIAPAPPATFAPAGAFRQALRGFACLLGGIALWMAIAVVARKVTGSESQYLEQFAAAMPLAGIKAILLLARDHIFGHSAVHATYLWLWAYLGVFVVALGSWVLRERAHPTRVLGVLGGTVLLMLAPFAHALTSGAVTPIRSLFAVPVTFFGLTLAGYAMASRRLRYVFVTSTALLVISFCVSTNRLADAAFWALQRDTAIATTLTSRAAVLLAEHPGVRDVEIIGRIDLPPSALAPRIEHVGASFFAWEDGNRWRISSFLRHVGFPTLPIASPETRRTLLEVASGLPSWPAPGSMVVVNRTLIIKLGRYARRDAVELCATSTTPDSCLASASPP
ncbi:MAG: glucosyltransferase domain-containing protein [Casimicrobiaceae bacterium]